MLPAKFASYTELVQAAGYDVGFTGKGWGPALWDYYLFYGARLNKDGQVDGRPRPWTER